MPEFVDGLRLGGRFYEEAVAPVVASGFPGLVYSAALIGSGSEILGYDTPRSTDHEWGPRLQLFLREHDHRLYAGRIVSLLSRELPPEFMGYSTHFGTPDEEGVQVPEKPCGPVNHKVEVLTLRRFFGSWTGLDPHKELEATDWLLVPQQKLLEVTAGRVYHDGLGELENVRARLAYYPRDVWLLLLAAQWWRISQQDAFVGRTGEVGDELGSKLIAATLVRDLMRLCFLMEKEYAPYSKWFGSAFARLECAGELTPIFERAWIADHWKGREEYLIQAYEYVARMHEELGITPPMEVKASRFHDRPFLVIHADSFAQAIEAAIEDPEVRAIRARFGSVDQFVDSTSVLSRPDVYGRLRPLYGTS